MERSCGPHVESLKQAVIIAHFRATDVRRKAAFRTAFRTVFRTAFRTITTLPSPLVHQIANCKTVNLLLIRELFFPGGLAFLMKRCLLPAFALTHHCLQRRQISSLFEDYKPHRASKNFHQVRTILNMFKIIGIAMPIIFGLLNCLLLSQ